MAKRRTPRPSSGRWALVWLVQALIALALGAATALSLWLGGFAYGLCRWLLMPLGGAVASYLAVRRRLNNYLAFLAPPLMEVLANLLIWGYSPDPGPVFLCGFLSLVGAAAGEVRNRQGRGR